MMTCLNLCQTLLLCQTKLNNVAIIKTLILFNQNFIGLDTVNDILGIEYLGLMFLDVSRCVFLLFS